MSNEHNLIFDAPEEWMKKNRNKLDEYSGKWIAFNKNGVISHNKDVRVTWEEAKRKNVEYVLKYVHPFEIARLIKIVPIRVRSLKGSKWQPDYPIVLSTSKNSEKL